MNIFRKLKKIFKVIATVFWGYYTTHKIGGFKAKEPLRDILPPYIQQFCKKMVNSFDIEVVQVEPVPQTHALWASNHISWMDIPVVGSVSPIFFLSKAEIANWKVVGKLARGAGTFFIERGSGDAGSVSEQLARFLRTGSSVLFFPEATTTSGHKMKRIHGKLLKAAMDTGVPIQPIVICYADEHGNISDDIAYFGKMTMKESLDKVLNSRKVKAYVLALEPLFAKGETQKELTMILEERMQTGLAKLQQRVLKNQPADALWKT